MITISAFKWVPPFTDRFAVDPRLREDKHEGKPSGRHPFDRVCAETGIEHRLTRPYRPQTNGMAERFNRPHRRGHRPGEEARHRLPAVRLP